MFGTTSEKFDYDVVIIGAGISGVCFAHRLQERQPHLNYCILESRSEVGGTWSLFKYPGLRSDSDLYTFGYSWKPWEAASPIAKGEAIVTYLQSAVTEEGIDKHIKFDRKVEQMAWSSETKSWTIDATVKDTGRETIRSRFIMTATGYYDYHNPLEAYIPGIKDFEGTVVHPQFWPEDLDYSGKNVVIIGSGATAITLLPAMAKDAKHITMLQRSPSYILSVPSQDTLENFIRAYLPLTVARRLIRLKWILLPSLFRQISMTFPNAARNFMRKTTIASLQGDELMDPHFKPTYNPFQQRMCMCPDGDFYECLRNGTGSIQTGKIDTVTKTTIKLDSGAELHPDIIVTATGLKLRLGGGINITVDGKPYEISKHYVWKGVMLENLPNLAFSFGYLDASWTLAVDISAQLACRLLDRMQKDRVDVIVPRLNDEEKQSMKQVPFMPLSSTYVEKAASVLPKLGNRPQWRGRLQYLWELFTVRFGDIKTGLESLKMF